MKKIEVLSIGELKFSALKEMEKIYSQKIARFLKFSPTSLKEIKIKDEDARIKKEATSFQQYLRKDDFIIALDPHGKKLDSIKFSGLIEDKITHHPGRIVFLIGGHCGLSPSLDPMIDTKISFSDLTFSHDIFRILFLEQLYRAFTIMKGIKYHR